ncbi:MAG: MgtC/SapB family protein [Acidobacteriia bacterium]|nr:MgtC/SapB family protein [Terriglobia bacterium]
MQTLQHSLDLLRNEMGVVLSSTLFRLLVAAILGGIIGLERELRHKPAGLRTNMFICFGAAMFTVLGDELASSFGGDHTRVAAQIIPGIGFIGAGSILHSRGSVTGLTTAATLFVVASVGMAAGGGLYITAAFATGVILIALAVLGKLERQFALKSMRYSFEVVGKNTEAMLGELNRILDEERLGLQDVRAVSMDGLSRVVFGVDCVRPEHEALTLNLHQSTLFSSVNSLGGTERE